MTTHTDDRFEERLLTELRAHVAQQAATAAAPSISERGRSARRLALAPRGPRLAVAGGGVAVAAAIAIVATAGGGADPAYAVESHANGSVTVTIRSLSDAAGLQSQLRAAGVDADVVKLDPGYVCGLGSGGGSLSVRVERPAPGGSAGGGTRGLHGSARSDTTPPPGSTGFAMKRAADGTTTFTVHRGQLSDDEHLLISTTTPAGQSDGALVAVTVAHGDGSGCTPTKAPAPPAGAPATP